MPYLVRLTSRALRDLETIYKFIEAETSERAFAWFNELAEKIGSLERFAGRGSLTPENKKLRQLIFGKKPNTHRIIYRLDKRNHVVTVLHIRHGARIALLK